jgi:hypothetical protein
MKSQVAIAATPSQNRTPRTIRIRKAGTEAIAHFTMKRTIDRNGILRSGTERDL